MERLTQEEKDRVIKFAGPHRTINFHFVRKAKIKANKRAKLVCVGARLER